MTAAPRSPTPPTRCAVALPRRLFKVLSYRVPPDLAGRIAPGMRVLAPLGRARVEGYVVGLDPEDLEERRLKSIYELLDERPLFDSDLLGLLSWAAEYYRHPLGEALKGAHPPDERTRHHEVPRYRLTAEGRGRLRAPAGQAEMFGDAPKDPLDRLLRLLAARPRTLSALKRAAGRDFTRPRLARLLEDGLVAAVVPRSRVGTRRRTVRRVHPVPKEPERRLGPRQRALLDRVRGAPGLSVSELRRAFGASAGTTLKSLVARELLRVEETVEFQAPPSSRLPVPPRPERLTPAQQEALTALRQADARGKHAAFLLWGVTGSGKTEVYLRIAEEVLASGRTVLVLVPEIALTPQLAARFRDRFGEQVAVLHSALTPSVRKDEWQRCREGLARIALGPRSAVFAPLQNLGLIVVDEEHDGSLKAEDGFRYSARDLAVMRARRSEALLVLGSATPSLESLRNAERGRYVMLRLPERVTPRPLPEVSIVPARGFSDDEALGPDLHRALTQTLQRGEQAMLFLNRRGFAPILLCRACGSGAECPNCSVGLTAHRREGRLMCHYCGYTRRIPKRCENCGSERVGLLGVGTERLEAEVRRRFPAARTARLDRDAVVRRGAVESILEAFARGERDVLLGTQMLAKGHDFPNVTLVGIVLADIGMNMPDFRATERTLQLLTQVSGRAGRGEEPGRVIVQALDPAAPAITAARDGDLERFYRTEMRERRDVGYPPFTRLALVRIEGPDEQQVAAAAGELRDRARRARVRGARFLGPAPAPLFRLRRKVRWQLLIKADDDRSRRRALDRLLDGQELILKPPTGVRLSIDIDPVNML